MLQRHQWKSDSKLDLLSKMDMLTSQTHSPPQNSVLHPKPLLCSSYSKELPHDSSKYLFARVLAARTRIMVWSFERMHGWSLCDEANIHQGVGAVTGV